MIYLMLSGFRTCRCCPTRDEGSHGEDSGRDLPACQTEASRFSGDRLLGGLVLRPLTG